MDTFQEVLDRFDFIISDLVAPANVVDKLRQILHHDPTPSQVLAASNFLEQDAMLFFDAGLWPNRAVIRGRNYIQLRDAGGRIRAQGVVRRNDRDQVTYTPMPGLRAFAERWGREH